MVDPNQRTQDIENYLCIDDKHRNVVPFKLNTTQRHLIENRGRREIILKSRQVGITSVILADMFMEAVTVPNTICVIVSHAGFAAERLLSRVDFFYKNFPEPKPYTDHYSSYEINFPRMHSVIYIVTQKSVGNIRGERVDRALLSEISRYERGSDILNAMQDAVPMDTGILTCESTPFGEDNIFYEEWVKAKEKRSNYKPFFFPWWECADYQLPQGSEFALEGDKGNFPLEKDERDLAKQYNLTKEQLRWRRMKIAEKGALFFQEYPESDVDCWKISGEPVFPPDVLSEKAMYCCEGKRHQTGWTYWQEPEENQSYVIGADCAAGAETGTYSAAAVIDDNWKICATYQARLDPARFADILRELGYHYNTAKIAVERNAQGYAVLSNLTEYPNLYYQRDYTTGKQTEKLGWWTSEQTKNYIVTTFRQMLPTLIIYDSNIVRQARSYTYLKYKPTTRGFDDLLIATMIGVAVKQVWGTSRGYVGTASRWGR